MICGCLTDLQTKRPHLSASTLIQYGRRMMADRNRSKLASSGEWRSFAKGLTRLQGPKDPLVIHISAKDILDKIESVRDPSLDQQRVVLLILLSLIAFARPFDISNICVPKPEHYRPEGLVLFFCY